MSETDKAPPPRYTAVDLLRALLDEFQVDSLHDAIMEQEGHPRVKRFDEICAKAKALVNQGPEHGTESAIKRVRAMYQDCQRIADRTTEDLSLRVIRQLCPSQIELRVTEQRVLMCQMPHLSWLVTADRWLEFAERLAVDGSITGWLVASGRLASEWVDHDAVPVPEASVDEKERPAGDGLPDFSQGSGSI